MDKLEKLRMWQNRYERDKAKWQDERAQMDIREEYYKGGRTINPIVPGDEKRKDKKAPYVHNIILENIESEVSASIPMPKVTARRKKDERLAALVENMLRNELDRLPFEIMNDMQERTCPIQGGTFWLVSWDESQGEAGRSGEVDVQAEHPKRVIPQDGISSGMDEMDWVFLELPQTKRTIRKTYGVDLDDMAEEHPEIRSTDDPTAADELVTQIVVLYRNEEGSLGRFSWCCDTVLEDLDDYYARHLPVCSDCGEVRPANLTDEDPCPNCGGTSWRMKKQEYEELDRQIETAHGNLIGPDTSSPMVEAAVMTAIQAGDPIETALPQPEKIPYYKPKKFPLILQRNVPIYGRLLGMSDVDAIKDQQNGLNWLDRKIYNRIGKAGTRITLPPKANFKMDANDQETWYLSKPADAEMIGVYDFKGDLEYEFFLRSSIVQQARDILGITQSFQGRQDETAQSGIAKQFAAAQTAGRLESKRVCKDAAYAELFECIFQHRLAFADEPRPVVYQDDRGETIYDSFDRYDFLEKDENGEWVWNDNFLFSTDASSGLAINRQAMWQEITAALQAGSFGDPTQTETLMLYWGKLEDQHYPGAAETAKYFRDKLEQEKQMAQLQQVVQNQQTMPAPAAQPLGAAMPQDQMAIQAEAQPEGLAL